MRHFEDQFQPDGFEKLAKEEWRRMGSRRAWRGKRCHGCRRETILTVQRFALQLGLFKARHYLRRRLFKELSPARQFSC